MQSPQPSPIAVSSQQVVCPTCGAVAPVHPGFVTWCDQCGWNVSPQPTPPPANVVERVHRRLSRRWSAGLLQEMLAVSAPRRSVTAATVGAMLLATPVHLLTLLSAGLGLYLVATAWPHLLLMLLGVVCLGLAWALAPRPRKAPPAEESLDRSAAPELHRLVDEVAAALGAKPVSAVVLQPQVNAWVVQHDLVRRGVSLHLGLPLLTALEGDELVALLGHELGHTVNGDPASGFYLGSAIDSLLLWRYVVRPNWDLAGLFWLAALPVNRAAIALGWLVEAYTLVLAQLIWRDSQRAEYLADYLAAGVAGGEAMRRMTEKLLFAPTVGAVVQRLAVGSNNTERGLFDALRAQLAQVPDRELERRRRAAQADDAAIDTTHPPTANRLRFVAAHPEVRTPVLCPSARLEAIRAEMRLVEPAMSLRMVDGYRTSLYW